MEAMCHTLRGRKSKSVDKIKKKKKQMRKGHVARKRWEEISHLNQVDQFGGREGKKKRERKRKKIK